MTGAVRQGEGFLALYRQSQGSGAKAILTSNWGVDFNLLLKSGAETALDVQILYPLGAS